MAESFNPSFGNWDKFFNVILKNFPDIAPMYKAGFSKLYWDETEKKINNLCLEYNIKLKGFYRH